MGKFTGGLIAGASLGAIGLAIALSDRRTRKRVMRNSKRTLDKASDFMHHM